MISHKFEGHACFASQKLRAPPTHFHSLKTFPFRPSTSNRLPSLEEAFEPVFPLFYRQLGNYDGTRCLGCGGVSVLCHVNCPTEQWRPRQDFIPY